MTFVYAVAFSGDEFLMIRNRRRGWEMPGGKVEPGETPEQAVRREFSEETGGELKIISTMRIAKGTVFFGTTDRRKNAGDKPASEEVADISFFHSLPDGLSFSREEYETVLKEARRAVNARRQ